MNKREKGTFYESLACDYIRENGGQILETNFTCRTGEIDIIAKDDKYIVYVEVKYRTDSKYGPAEAAVDFRKQKVISRISDFYRKKNGLGDNVAQRFDVIAISTSSDDATKVRWLKNAFPYIPSKTIRYY